MVKRGVEKMINKDFRSIQCCRLLRKETSFPFDMIETGGDFISVVTIFVVQKIVNFQGSTRH